MKNNNEEIDQIIKESLTKEEAQFYDELDEQNLLQMFGGLFKTKHSWLIILMNVVNLVVFGIFIYCIVQFLNTEETNGLIKWAAAGVLCWSTLAMIKLFVWMQMDKNALLREIKRLELQIAALANKAQ
ncbi:DUF6768 family protein [Aureibaculum sp. 2210JD6-5]|uniref:DUF6768 family protein n=1 Tax=Aureibaculum sp. 2210JD6-5 TaxID=3103957 RepID=UPI002AADBEB8|nr:DUF6768 family protein [Aureibaculum sp. 2210JD6-5]MDY7395471.1 DUF6768 family protein [Aureibaculum sp. 2210JD6-5]